ncbi:glycosyltransferase family 4 protein [Paenibacillus daejeonensis]|uniref:glycosyltransferase family 4 protein n=1 Tax=Paenibacillus daejeonensis TaxID=135193 RepID=UPI00036A5039|nr:glycosyltransferase family 4 protein [Paenibacillus daejeonensis]
MPRPSVVIAHSLYPPHIIGGAEVSTQILAETLGSRYEVTVVTVGPQERETVEESHGGVRILRLPHHNLYWFGDTQKQKSTMEKIAWRIRDVYNTRQGRRVQQILEQIKPDLIHTQNLAGLSLSVWQAARRANVPIVHTLRDYSLFDPIPFRSYSMLYHQAARRMSSAVSAVVGISEHVLAEHRKRGFFRDAAAGVISNAVTPSVQAEQLYLERTITGGPLRVGYFGQIQEIKGVRHLVEAVRSLPPELVSELWICGDGPELAAIRELAAGDARITCTGKLSRAETMRRMSEVDLTVVPSVWEEPFGRVIIESYQVGTPVLASRIGGIPEVLEDPSCCAFDPGSAQAIADKLRSYSTLSEEARRHHSVLCHAHSRRYGTDQLLAHHDELYGRLLYPAEGAAAWRQAL